MASPTKKASRRQTPSFNSSPVPTSSLALIIGMVLLLFGIVFWFLYSGQPLTLWPLITLIILILLIFVAVGFAIYSQKTGQPHQPDYYTIFFMGLLWAPLGLVMDNYPLSVMGLVFLAIGLKNKHQWKKPPPWSELPPDKKRFKLALMTGLGLLVIFGLIAYFLAG